VFELEAQEPQHFAVEVLRARKVADAQDQVIDADDAHGVLRFTREISARVRTASLNKRGISKSP
jgi:hypothetical protein